MKILAPTNSVDEAVQLIEAGCEELYVGVMSRRWLENYHNSASANRREWSSANLDGFDELAQLVAAAHKREIPVYLTLNAMYTDGQYDIIEKELHEAADAGIDAAIVADLGLLHLIREKKMPFDIHISTGGTSFNAQTVEFYKQQGAQRVILPRQLRRQEIIHISESAGDMELEIFMLNSPCRNIDGYCSFSHGLRSNISKNDKRPHFFENLTAAVGRNMHKLPGPIRYSNFFREFFASDNGCGLNYSIEIRNGGDTDRNRRKRIKHNIGRHFISFHGRTACAACSLFNFQGYHLNSLKIVGRDRSTEKKIKDVTFLKRVREACGAHENRETFSAAVQNIYKEIYKADCMKQCYFYEETD